MGRNRSVGFIYDDSSEQLLLGTEYGIIDVTNLIEVKDVSDATKYKTKLVIELEAVRWSDRTEN